MRFAALLTLLLATSRVPPGEEAPARVIALLRTSGGDITMRLFTERENGPAGRFLESAASGAYDG